jgi:NAD dependent epimerase/dehydratase family enzyme
LGVALKRKWVVQDLDSRALGVTSLGSRELAARFGLLLGAQGGCIKRLGLA